MAGEKPLSSLFGDMQGGSSVPTPSSTTPTSLPDKKENIFGALEGVSETQKLQGTEPAPSPSSESTGLFGEAVPQKIETVLETSGTLPEVEILSPPVVPISDVTPVVPPSPETSLPDNISVLPELPEVAIAPSSAPISSEEIVPSIETVATVLPEDTSLPEVETLPAETHTLPTSEVIPVPVAPAESPEPKNTQDNVKDKKEDPKLTQYLHADAVYQEMIRVDNQEKIRLQIAVRYTLLMFAIFLVFAWIVSNRVIMFGFSEFVWLARIRDALFAVMAGLFSLTLWFGSVSWMRQIYLIAFIRTLAVVFFIAVLIALYLPL